MGSRTGLFPLNEKDRLLTPPEILEPGHESLIFLIESMKFIANRLCSSIPVATARIFGSKMISWGSNPISSTNKL